jgi:hypothetical protein
MNWACQPREKKAGLTVHILPLCSKSSLGNPFPKQNLTPTTPTFYGVRRASQYPCESGLSDMYDWLLLRIGYTTSVQEGGTARKEHNLGSSACKSCHSMLHNGWLNRPYIYEICQSLYMSRQITTGCLWFVVIFYVANQWGS